MREEWIKREKVNMHPYAYTQMHALLGFVSVCCKLVSEKQVRHNNKGHNFENHDV